MGNGDLLKEIKQAHLGGDPPLKGEISLWHEEEVLGVEVAGITAEPVGAVVDPADP